MFKRIILVVTLLAILRVYVGKTKRVDTRENVSRRIIRYRNTIPATIPKGITHVVLEGFNSSEYVSRGLFKGQGWKYISSLTFTEATDRINLYFMDNCFNSMTHLKEIHIHVKGATFQAETFTHLPKLDLIDLRGCSGWNIYDVKLSSTSLKHIDLSENNLNSLRLQNGESFASFLNGFPSLTFINLARNELSDVPDNLFKYLINLEVINLSFNELTHLQVNLETLKHLQLLNISGNHISFRDEKDQFYSNLNMVQKKKIRLDLSFNPLPCSKCADVGFLEWLLTNRDNIATFASLTCIGDQGLKVSVNTGLHEYLDEMCMRTFQMHVIPIGAICIVLAFAYGFIRYSKKVKAVTYCDAIPLLKRGREEHEFIVFLAHSSRDEEFVNEHVLNALQSQLQSMIGTDREVVCIGDRHFRFGQYIHDETVRCLEQSAMVVVLVSDNFCESRYCRLEFDLAYDMGKPIILMVKDDVDENKMSPTLKLIYKTCTRILWRKEHDKYVLKTTWLNVCSSIMEVIFLRLKLFPLVDSSQRSANIYFPNISINC